MMRKLKRAVVVFGILVGLGVVLLSASPLSRVYAATNINCPPGQTRLSEGGACCPTGMVYLDENDSKNNKVCCPPTARDSATSCLYAKYVNPIISVLSVIAGLAAVIGIVIGGVQYASSSGDSQKAAAARSKITKAAAGFITFLFLYSLLQFFSPGGISSNTSIPAGQGTIAQRCSKDFLTLKPWFAYLPNSAFDEKNNSCAIVNFSLLGRQDASGKTVEQSQLILVVLAILDNLVRLAGIVAVGFVIMGGVLFVTSQGDPEKAKRARMSIFNALIGVVIAIIAASVISYIGTQLSS